MRDGKASIDAVNPTVRFFAKFVGQVGGKTGSKHLFKCGEPRRDGQN